MGDNGAADSFCFKYFGPQVSNVATRLCILLLFLMGYELNIYFLVSTVTIIVWSRLVDRVNTSHQTVDPMVHGSSPITALNVLMPLSTEGYLVFSNILNTVRANGQPNRVESE